MSESKERILERMHIIADYALDFTDNTSVDDICAELGISKTTYYKNINDERYFKILKSQGGKVFKATLPKILKSLDKLIDSDDSKLVIWFIEYYGLLDNDITDSDEDILQKVIDGEINKDLLPEEVEGE